jgi:hypothetical protein
MSTLNVNNVVPQSGAVVNVNGIVAKEVVNGPFVLYGGTAYNANTSTGSGVTIVGTGAMLNNTGNNNTAIGASALRANTTATSNTAIGHQSALYNTTGSNNTAVGKDALLGQSGLSTGAANTAIGFGSLQAITTGGTNTAVGNTAGFSVTTGTNNTFLGSQAGSLLTTGTSNICIGYDAQAATVSASNSFTLGNGSVSVLRCAVTSITSLSDARDKKDITPIDLGLEFVKELNPVKFVWDDRNETGKHNVVDSGFIAQDLKALEDKHNASDILKLVYDENPEKLEASYGRLIPVLVKAIQELTAKVEALENK